MLNLFEKISEKESVKLENMLESHRYTIPKNASISSILTDHVIGILLSGSAKIIRTDYNGNQNIIEDLEDGSIFGSNISYLKNKEYDFIAYEECKILVFDYDVIINSNSNLPYYNQFLKNLITITTNKIEERNDRIQVLSKKTIRDRLLEYFEIESTKHGSSTVYLPFSFSEFADYIAVDRSSMHRELKHLKDERFIDIKGKKIILLYRHSFAL